MVRESAELRLVRFAIGVGVGATVSGDGSGVLTYARMRLAVGDAQPTAAATIAAFAK
jgi:hypothetical protein